MEYAVEKEIDQVESNLSSEMDIKDVEFIPLDVGFKSIDEWNGLAPYRSSYTKPGATSAPRTLVQLETEGGIIGWGEVLGTPSPKGSKAVHEDLIKPEVIGQSVGQVNALFEKFDFHSIYMDERVFLSGVEMAMWDALGKHLDLPVHQFFGGKVRTHVDFAYALGIASPEKSREKARAVAEQGFSVIKTKGSTKWEKDIDRLEAMREEVGDQIRYRIDANEDWSVIQAQRICNELAKRELPIDVIEQPLRIGNVGSYKQLRQKADVPIAVNDDAYFPHHIYQLVKEDAIDAALIELTAAGGLSQARRQAQIAGEGGIPVGHHCGMDLGVKTAAILQVAATTRELTLHSDTIYYSLEDHVIEEPFEFENGSLEVPDAPGLGIEVDTDAIERNRSD